MIINKSTSDQVLVSSLSISSPSGYPEVKVQEFNTDTKVLTDSAGATRTAGSFCFYFDTDEEYGQLSSVLPEALLSYRAAGKFKEVLSMVWEQGDPSFVLLNLGVLLPTLVCCSNCQQRYLVYRDQAGGVWSVARATPSDKHQAATPISLSEVACDSCADKVRVLR
jgi:hypothetical protein